MADKSKQYFTALDIGTSKICAIVAEKTDNNKLKMHLAALLVAKITFTIYKF